jgi:type IV secretory pathway VirB4 component
MAEKNEKIQASTQAYLPISEIKEGVVMMNDRSLRSVIIVSSLNFALKSEDEKNAVVTSYQQFLNSLSFPIQIVAHSRKIDLSGYLETINEASAAQTSPSIKMQTEEYRDFLGELLESSNIMEKRFYVIVPYFPSGIESIGLLGNLTNKSGKNQVTSNLEEDKKLLIQRTGEVINALTSVGLRCVSLGTEDLLELYYSSYNPDTSKNQKIGDIEKVDIPIVSASGYIPEENKL